jgi:hypothetical protein
MTGIKTYPALPPWLFERAKAIPDIILKTELWNLAGKFLTHDHYTVTVEITARRAGVAKIPGVSLDVLAVRQAPDADLVPLASRQRIKFGSAGGSQILSFTFPFVWDWGSPTGGFDPQNPKQSYFVLIDEHNELKEWDEHDNYLYLP